MHDFESKDGRAPTDWPPANSHPTEDEVFARAIKTLSKCRNAAVVFGLFGNSPRYTEGVAPNLAAVKTLYPGWRMVVLVGKDVPTRLIADMQLDPIIVVRSDVRRYSRAAARFFAIDDVSFDRLVFRDIDSRIGEREVAAVADWVEFGSIMHGMRDHPVDTRPLLAGMWGVKTEEFKQLLRDAYGGPVSMEELYLDYLVRQGGSEAYGTDESFLADILGKTGNGHLLSHETAYFDHPLSRPFPVPRKSERFIGEVAPPWHSCPPGSNA